MGSPAMGSKRPQSNYLDTKQTSSPRSMERRSSPNHTRSTSLSGVHVPVTESRQHSDDDDEEALETGNKKPSVEEEPELDIDIAKAYCELTEGKNFIVLDTRGHHQAHIKWCLRNDSDIP